MGDADVTAAVRGLQEKLGAKQVQGVIARQIEATVKRVEGSPDDARGLSGLADLLYAAGLREEAIGWWERAVKADRKWWWPWRNLGLAYWNVLRDTDAAVGAMERAFQADSTQASLFYERDQVWKKARRMPQMRLEELERRVDLVGQHKVLAMEYAAILNQLQQHERARDVAETYRKDSAMRDFLGLLVEWVRAQIALGRRALWRKDAAEACTIFAAALQPAAEGESQLMYLSRHAELQYWVGAGRAAAGDGAGAKSSWELAAKGGAKKSAVWTFYTARVLEALGRRHEAGPLYAKLAAGEIGVRPAPPVAPAGGLAGLEPDPEDAARHNVVAEALGRFGLGEQKTAKRLLSDVLRDDPNHTVAADLLISLDWEV